MDFLAVKAWLKANWMFVGAGLAVLIVLFALMACGTPAPETFAEKLKGAGFGAVDVEADKETKTERHYNSNKNRWEEKKVTKTVAYDVNWTYDNPNTPGLCVVEVEHPYSSGRLSPVGWHVDEVVDNAGQVHEVEGKGWGAGSPSAAQVRADVTTHGINC